MKKFAILVFLWCSILAVTMTVSGRQQNCAYRILFDSLSENEYEVKTEMTDIYHELTRDVNEDSRAVLVNKSLKAFEFEDNMKASFESNTLVLTIGDGKGSKIEGRFDQVSCFKEVKPKSWIMEMLGS